MKQTKSKSLRWLGRLSCLPDLVVINCDWAELLLIGSSGRGPSLDVWAGELQAGGSAGVIALLPLFCWMGTENAPFANEEDCWGENCSVDFLDEPDFCKAIFHLREQLHTTMC